MGTTPPPVQLYCLNRVHRRAYLTLFYKPWLAWKLRVNKKPSRIMTTESFPLKNLFLQWTIFICKGSTVLILPLKCGLGNISNKYIILPHSAYRWECLRTLCFVPASLWYYALLFHFQQQKKPRCSFTSTHGSQLYSWWWKFTIHCKLHFSKSCSHPPFPAPAA